MSVNKVILVGNLGKDPEMRMTQSQMAVCSFSLATAERRKDSSGQWTDHTEWHKISCFGKTAENCGKYLKKGKQVYIEGQLRTSKWTDKEGKDRYTTEILANTVQFLGGKESSGGYSQGADSGAENYASNEEVQRGKNMFGSMKSADAMGGSAAPAQAANGGAMPFDDDDIPF